MLTEEDKTVTGGCERSVKYIIDSVARITESAKSLPNR